MYYIIFNPTAGAGRSIKVLKSIQQHFSDHNKEYILAETAHAGHASVLAKEAVGKGYHGILSVGGDGTLLEVAASLHGTDETLGVIPAGTGNDFREAVGIPKDPIAALDIIFAGHCRRVDMGLINDDKCFLNVAGTGFDVDVIKNTNRVRRVLTGGAAYYIGIVMSIFGYKNASIDITVEGKTTARKVLLLAVANGQCYGGGLKIGPSASVSDGLFNVVIINRIPKWRILIELPKLKRGELDKISVLEQFTCSELTITSNQPYRLNLDGDIDGQTPATFRLAPKALKVFCPK
jgi:YegS/Rv2252/BmrU family lipid kinase